MSGDTIYALSSGRPPAAIGVVRVSGPGAIDAAAALTRGRVPAARRAAVRGLRDGTGALLDRALVLVFPGPESTTGEDLVELHCHGGRAVVAGVEAALGALGLRQAEAGEFTRRALTNGRIDLAEAEGLADLLEAGSEAERRAALDAVEGRVSAMLRGWLDRLALVAARIEAELDFADEADVHQGHPYDARGDLAALGAEIEAVLAAPSVERLRDGVRVVLGGPPNAGKSTLLNALAEREAAIVSPIAGTTRDRIEAGVLRRGVAYALTDTAGLTATDDAIEAIGVARAGEAIAAADLLLWLGDEPPPRAGALWLWPRADVRGDAPAGRLSVSAGDRASVDALWRVIEARAAAMMPATDRPVLRERQRAACARAAALMMGDEADPVLVAERVRLAHRVLAALLGIDATEAMLDALFGRFCIGK